MCEEDRRDVSGVLALLRRSYGVWSLEMKNVHTTPVRACCVHGDRGEMKQNETIYVDYAQVDEKSRSMCELSGRVFYVSSWRHYFP